MIGMEHLDIRTTTLGISLRDCATGSGESTARNVYEKIMRLAKNLVPTARQIELEHGIPIINKRVSVTPVALLGADDPLPIAKALDRAATEIGIDFLGGYSALVQKDLADPDKALIETLPAALSQTSRLCGSVNVADSRTGINMDACLAV